MVADDEPDVGNGPVFHAWILDQLAERQMSPRNLAELSRASGVGEAAFSRWKRGSARPSVMLVRRVALALGMDTVPVLAAAEILLAEEIHYTAPDMGKVSNYRLLVEVGNRLLDGGTEAEKEIEL